MNLDKLSESLKKHEGIKNLPYKDSEGHLSIGVGHNLSMPISHEAIFQILKDDVYIAQRELDRSFPGWKDHSDARQNVLIEMMFNLGAPRLASFKMMWAALDKKDYFEAATELLDSKYADQVGQRAITLAEQLRAGEF